jgi:hypothetical protein
MRRVRNLAHDLFGVLGPAVAVSGSRYYPGSDLYNPANMSRTGGLRSAKTRRTLEVCPKMPRLRIVAPLLIPRRRSLQPAVPKDEYPLDTDHSTAA